MLSFLEPFLVDPVALLLVQLVAVGGVLILLILGGLLFLLLLLLLLLLLFLLLGILFLFLFLLFLVVVVVLVGDPQAWSRCRAAALLQHCCRGGQGPAGGQHRQGACAGHQRGHRQGRQGEAASAGAVWPLERVGVKPHGGGGSVRLHGGPVVSKMSFGNPARL
ncbi:MAG: hypothetical protein FJ057_07210 [Cyanobacteria bacterium K_DeepCast_0m_m1_088]|nr:hypothetical protein [Cyanobacteria bacterium K_DeepCast_0m_m1_088]